MEIIMEIKKLCRADLHIHTNRSRCSPRETTVSAYLPYCKGEGIKTIGISNHIYKPSVLGVKYPENINYALSVREEIDAIQNKTDVKILLGCEVETFHSQDVGVSVADARAFDYVLLAASHIFNWKHEYDGFDLSTPEAVKKILIENFVRACEVEYDVPVGICHPLYPIMCPFEYDVVRSFTDEELEDCFTLAAQKRRSIEIHACLSRNGTPLDDEGISPSYVHFLEVAKKCGCKFHFGADIHVPSHFSGSHEKLEIAARRVGITEDDLWELAK